MSTDRQTQRDAMNAAFGSLPDWLRAPFAPFRDAVSLLLDRREDALALAMTQAIQPPLSWTAEQVAHFDAVKAGIVAKLEQLIADALAADPLRSPEALAMLAAAAERRAA